MRAARGVTAPVTSGRPLVRSISASMSRSTYMLMALAPPAASVPPSTVQAMSHSEGQALLGDDHRRHGGDEEQLDDPRLRERDVPHDPGTGRVHDGGHDRERLGPSPAGWRTGPVRSLGLDVRPASPPACASGVSRSTPARTGRSPRSALVALGAIIVSGAAVRLTGSGMGCPTWPTCEDGSLVPRGATGANGWIEFVNRTFTGAVSVAVVARRARRPPPPTAPPRPRRAGRGAWSPGWSPRPCSGGSWCVLHVTPIAVAGHYLLSAVLVANAVVLHHRAGEPAGTATRRRATPQLLQRSRGARRPRRLRAGHRHLRHRAAAPTAATRRPTGCRSRWSPSPGSTASRCGCSWPRSSSCCGRWRRATPSPTRSAGAACSWALIVAQGTLGLRPVRGRRARDPRRRPRARLGAGVGGRAPASTSP